MIKLNQLFKAWRKEDKDMQIIKTQKHFIYLIFVICLMCFAGWMSAPSRLRIYIPPDISNGATIKIGEIPSSLIYSFAYQIWQEVNYWPKSGTTDYPNNIHTWWSYLTPSFQAYLLRDDQTLQAKGQVQRQRFLQGVTGAAFNSANVKKLSDNSWEVDLKMRLMEYKNNQVVKDVEILYPIEVTRMDISQANNPYGLALAGFVSSPQRLKTYV